MDNQKQFDDAHAAYRKLSDEYCDAAAAYRASAMLYRKRKAAVVAARRAMDAAAIELDHIHSRDQT